MSAPDGLASAMKRAELLRTTGGFALGVGAGTWLSTVLAKYAWVVLVGGGLMDAVGMHGKQRIDTNHGMRQPWRYRLLHWLCWGRLAVLATSLVVTRT